MKPQLLIDLDEIKYKVYFKNVDHPIEYASSIVYSYLDIFQTDDFILFASCPRSTNFRKSIYPPYKAHRSSSDDTRINELTKLFLEAFMPITEPRLEADDLIGIYATLEGSSLKKIIISQDKDMLTIPGFIYNPRTKELIENSKEDATLFLWYQVLMGDSADGYPGAPKIGKVRARRIIDDAVAHDKDLETVVKSYFSSEEEYLQNVRCARILQNGDYDFKRRLTRYEL